MAWKYIVMQVGNREVPVIFPEDMVHSLMLEAVREYWVKMALEASQSIAVPGNIRKVITPVAAGECMIEVVSASGHSATLNVGSREIDRAWLNSYPYHHGHIDAPWPSRKDDDSKGG